MASLSVLKQEITFVYCFVFLLLLFLSITKYSVIDCAVKDLDFTCLLTLNYTLYLNRTANIFYSLIIYILCFKVQFNHHNKIQQSKNKFMFHSTFLCHDQHPK